MRLKDVIWGAKLFIGASVLDALSKVFDTRIVSTNNVVRKQKYRVCKISKAAFIEKINCFQRTVLYQCKMKTQQCVEFLRD